MRKKKVSPLPGSRNPKVEGLSRRTVALQSQLWMKRRMARFVKEQKMFPVNHYCYQHLLFFKTIGLPRLF